MFMRTGSLKTMQKCDNDNDSARDRAPSITDNGLQAYGIQHNCSLAMYLYHMQILLLATGIIPA